MGGRTTTLAPSTTTMSRHSPTTTSSNTASLPVTVPVSLTWGAAQHLPTSSSMQYIFNVQRTFGNSTTVEAGYTGSVSRHLAYLLNENQGILNPLLPVLQRLPYPEWGASGIQYLAKHI